jgi:uncharacterized damage-inducible protein DinB
MDTRQMWRDFVEGSAVKLECDAEQCVRCARLLTEAEAWSRTNENCNSVANLLLHLTGNIRQWILGGVGGQAIQRDRPAEFAARGPAPIEPILAAFQDAIARAAAVIRAVDEMTLAEPRRIQSYEVSAMLAIYHVVEHLSGHTGQIVHMTKAIRNVSIARFDELGRRDGKEGGWPW